METWRLLAGLSVMLVLYAVVVTATGADVSPVQLVIAVAFGLFGLYIGRVLTERYLPDERE